ncbi:UNVERIFIED_CONTAM: hypothetical protein FKN15_065735 [Acipenser sinensis]
MSSRVFMMSYAEKPEDITKDEWMEKLNNVHIQRADMNRLIMNYLVTEGFKEAAEKFRMESGIEPNIDLDSLDERIKIREMILKGQIQEGISLINSLHPELLDTNRYLYFHLQQQHLIELIRQRETEAALEFAQTQLAEQGEESRECLTEMERTLALLAFDNPEDSPFGDLLNMMQRQKVWSEVNQAVLDYENRESTPKLAKLLKLLLWAQNELDQKKVKYPKMTDLSKGTIEEPNLFSQKVRQHERAFISSTVGTGSQIGTLLIGGAGSVLMDWYSWEFVFYVAGLLAVSWAYCIWKHLLKGFETAVVRKLMQFFAMGASSVFTLLLCGTRTFPLAIAFVSATMGFQTFTHSGVSVNVQDLAPSCAGSLYGVFFVYFSGYVIDTTGSWASVFALMSLVNVVGLVIFLVFAEAERVDIDVSKPKCESIQI